MNTSAKNYNTLQASIDKVIGEIGLDKTVSLLESFIDNAAECVGSEVKIKLVTQYLVTAVCDIFSLNEAKLMSSPMRDYRDGRMCCFHLLHKYTSDSYVKIGLAFHTNDRIVRYGVNKTAERLEYPKGNAVFTQNYNAMESRLIAFISKLN